MGGLSEASTDGLGDGDNVDEDTWLDDSFDKASSPKGAAFDS